MLPNMQGGSNPDGPLKIIWGTVGFYSSLVYHMGTLQGVSDGNGSHCGNPAQSGFRARFAVLRGWEKQASVKLNRDLSHFFKKVTSFANLSSSPYVGRRYRSLLL